MTTPISYFGGKQMMVRHILPLIPPLKTYSEPYCGGAAIYFNRPFNPDETEILNDTNSELINFYKVVQNNFVDLEHMIRATLHSRRLHQDAQVVYNNGHLFSEIKRAWAVWVLSSQSFSSILDGSWGYDKSQRQTPKKITNKRNSFSEAFAQRLEYTQLECIDAVHLIQNRDSETTFFYCDPPYINVSQGHYKGYMLHDYDRLLTALSQIKGKFLLSSYPSHILTRYTKAHGWYFKVFEKGLAVNGKRRYLKRKWEVLTANYPI